MYDYLLIASVEIGGLDLDTRMSWEELDDPNWRTDEGDDSHWDTIEALFDPIYTEFV